MLIKFVVHWAVQERMAQTVWGCAGARWGALAGRVGWPRSGEGVGSPHACMHLPDCGCNDMRRRASSHPLLPPPRPVPWLAQTFPAHLLAPQHPQTEDYWGNVNPIGERSCYDEGKRAAECLTMDYHREHGLEVGGGGRGLEVGGGSAGRRWVVVAAWTGGG